MHKDRLRLLPGGGMRLTGAQFGELLNAAFGFLGVRVDQPAASEAFAMADTDRDGFISYSEYFKFVEAFVCDFQKPSALRPGPKLQARPSFTEACEILVRFRRLLWGELFRIYVKYDSDGNGNMDDGEMTLLLKELLNETSKSELDYVFKNSFRMDANGDNNFVFEEFVPFGLRRPPSSSSTPAKSGSTDIISPARPAAGGTSRARTSPSSSKGPSASWRRGWSATASSRGSSAKSTRTGTGPSPTKSTSSGPMSSSPTARPKGCRASSTSPRSRKSSK